MADGPTAAIASMPPWGWGLLLLSGGAGGIGTFSGLNTGGHENCADRDELIDLEADLQSARNGLEASNATIQSLIDVIKEQKRRDGWIE